jgi:hypothetical protein
MIEAGSPGTTRWPPLVLSAAVLLLSACSAGGHAAAAAHRSVTTTSRATTTSTTATTTTTAAPTTTVPPTTAAPTTAAPTTTRAATPTTIGFAPPDTAPGGAYPYAGGPSSSCTRYSADDLAPGSSQAVSFNVQLTQYWSSGPTETASDTAPHVPPITLHLVGTRGTHFSVRIYWDPTQPSLRIPPGQPGAWLCDAELG